MKQLQTGQGSQADEKQRLIQKITEILRGQKCSTAVIFGSFAGQGTSFRDIDIMVVMEGGKAPTEAEKVYLAQVLSKESGYKVDIVGPDIPNILLKAEIARKGLPIIVEDPDFWERFKLTSIIDEEDFRPLIEKFYEERFGIKQR